MTTKVQKWGNSLAVRIPRSIAEDSRLASGVEVDLRCEDGAIVIRSVARPRPALAALLRGVTRRNLHREVTTGRPLGSEVW